VRVTLPARASRLFNFLISLTCDSLSDKTYFDVVQARYLAFKFTYQIFS